MADTDSGSESDFPEFTPLKNSSPSEDFEEQVADTDLAAAPEEALGQSPKETVDSEEGGQAEDETGLEEKLQGSVRRKQGKIRAIQETLSQVMNQLLWLKGDKAEQVEKVEACERVLTLRKQLQSTAAQIQFVRNLFTASALIPEPVQSWKVRIESLAAASISDFLHLTALRTRLQERKWVCALLLGLLLGLLVKRLSHSLR